MQITDRFRSEFGSLVDEARGMIKLINSVKGHLASKHRDDPLYRMTLKRLREDGIRLASYAECVSLLSSDEDRDALLSGFGCSWDPDKKRVDLH
jgi:hypothetical protein